MKQQLLEEAYALLQKRQFQEAHALFLRLQENEAADVRILYGLGLSYFYQQQIEAAIDTYTQALALAPTQAEIWSDRGVAYFHKGNKTAALNDLDEAQRLEPHNPYRYSSRAYIRASLKDLEGAIQDYEKAIELDPDDAVAYNNLGLLQDQLGYKQKAQKFYKKADALAQDQADAPSFAPKKEARKGEEEDAPVSQAEFKALKESILGNEQTEKQPSQIDAPPPKAKITLKSYWQVVCQIAQNKQERKAFWEFIKTTLQGKK
ncbi:tetratricopeptide repeat protein [Hugenholtzia roseola]|uniref:tetratricopeptide repeat protein n=1 Tax=Hugenholtzia roseola TaxID=1002 RepID=UPI0003FBFFF3|nr:tetratricopeptide repeat protein [Hugenholtzia roseola]